MDKKAFVAGKKKGASDLVGRTSGEFGRTQRETFPLEKREITTDWG